MGWLSGWQYRKSHEIEGSSAGAQTDYQVKIIVHKGTGTDSGEHVYCNNHCRDDFGDIRFTKDDGTTELYYWLEEYISGDKATFWVKIPSIPASPDKATIYIYYGKSDATTTSSGSDTFVVFDDFEGSTALSTRLNYATSGGGVGNYELSTSWAKHNSYSFRYYENSSTDDGSVEAYSTVSETEQYCTEVWVKPSFDNPPKDYHFGLLLDDQYAMTVGDIGADNDPRIGVYDMSIRDYAEYDSTTTPSQETVYKLVLKKNNDSSFSLEWYDESGKLIDSYTTTGSYTQSRAGIFAKSGNAEYGDCFFDVLLVRKYVDPEPTHESWGSEEQSGATEVAITDSATGIEALSRPYRGLNLTDITTGQESFSRPYRQLQIPEQASSLELLLKTRNLNLGDIAASLETIERARQIGTITDTAQSLEQILKQRFISLLDAAAGGETIARPTRMTILADEALSQEILSKLRELTAVTDSAIGIEYVNVGAEGAIKTRIFLLIGDLAIQITGD